ncbi:twin transmembrane helix small protein [Pontivivens nitratireducens]|uniref:Twin transmembrane helix small protein n=1 Tax=Pontivivens nitratireducens TaxID=2758038 RepID=A0A6G7VNS0_9RHOB|nr:twin transmembrane helix small protein [Pontibrevibacter nitratireducens]QIK41689.1 twin transmembrane helix small protein [Pontibrevibacter nitratireducens]
MVQGPLLYVIGIACLAVLVVLLIGVGGFAKGGDFNKKYANKIMRLRILLQFVAVVIIVIGVWIARGGS